MTELTVAAWNILLDKRYPQQERVESMISSLRQLDEQRRIGALGLLEVQRSEQSDTGEMIGRALFDNSGIWKPHSRKRLNEHIGFVGPQIEDVEFIDLKHGKQAALTHLGGVAVVAVHLRRQPQHIPPTPEQVNQTRVLLERLEDEDEAVVMGDFNCLWFQRPRRMLEAQGFKSAFSELGLRRPKTLPMPGFDGVLTPKRRAALRMVGGGINLDDIYVKNLHVRDVGTGKGKSDHAYVWATVENKLKK
jgi:hypothetical protein